MAVHTMTLANVHADAVRVSIKVAQVQTLSNVELAQNKALRLTVSGTDTVTVTVGLHTTWFAPEQTNAHYTTDNAGEAWAVAADPPAPENLLLDSDASSVKDAADPIVPVRDYASGLLSNSGGALTASAAGSFIDVGIMLITAMHSVGTGFVYDASLAALVCLGVFIVFTLIEQHLDCADNSKPNGGGYLGCSKFFKTLAVVAYTLLTGAVAAEVSRMAGEANDG